MADELNATKAWESARVILRYLESHPGAKDTLDGIARWWIQREWSERMLVEVERAVALLLARGLIVETRRPGVPPYYEVNPQERDTIAKILEGS